MKQANLILFGGTLILIAAFTIALQSVQIIKLTHRDRQLTENLEVVEQDLKKNIELCNATRLELNELKAPPPPAIWLGGKRKW